MNEWIEIKLGDLGNVYVKWGDIIANDVADHIKIDADGKARWVGSPVLDGKRLPFKTKDQVIGGGMAAMEREAEPIIYSLYNDHEEIFADLKAGMLEKYIEPKTFSTVLRDRASKKYRTGREEGWHTIKLNIDGNHDEARRTTYNLIEKGIHENKTGPEITRSIRENVFGLRTGEKNKGITYRANRIMRTELAYAEGRMEEEITDQNPDIYGVRIRYYGGPCPAGTCVAVLETGRNVQHYDGYVTADFYHKDGPIPWFPYHPHCYCAVARYLFELDWMKEVGRAA